MTFLGHVVANARHSFRVLRRTPAISGVVITTVALVVAAATSVFGLTEALFLRQLPFPRADELVAIRAVRDGELAPITLPVMRQLHARPDMPHLEAFAFEPVIAGNASRSTAIWIDKVSGGFFNLLGAKPSIGRAITPTDDSTAAQVAVVSEAFCREFFGADSSAIGRSIGIGDRRFTVVGVMPRQYSGIHFGRTFSVAIPISAKPGQRSAVEPIGLVARIPKQSLDSAKSRLATALRPLLPDAGDHSPDGFVHGSATQTLSVPDGPSAESDVPPQVSPRGFQVAFLSARHGLRWNVDVRAQFAVAVLSMLAVVLALLIIGCANTISLLTTRGLSRSHEIAVRRAVGASEGQLTALLFGESAAVAALGALAGIFLSWASSRVLMSLIGPWTHAAAPVPAFNEVSAFAVLLLCAIVLACGSIPALQIRKATASDSPLNLGRGVTHRTGKVERLLVVTQTSLALPLLVVSLLFSATLSRLTSSAGGYRNDSILIARARIDGKLENPLAEFRQLASDLTAVPGVAQATFALSSPLYADALLQARVRPVGSTLSNDVTVRINGVAPGFFDKSGIGLQQGIDISSAYQESGDVAVVSRSFAERHFRGQAVGREIVLDPTSARTRRPLRIIGVANDARYDRLQGQLRLRNTDQDVVYMPIHQLGRSPTSVTLIIRPERSDPVAAGILQAAKARPAINMERLATVSQLIADGTGPERLAARTTFLFAVLAFAMSLSALFSLITQFVSQRTRELGVRIALGASSADVTRFVASNVSGLIGTALAVGLPLAGAAALILRHQFYGLAIADIRLGLLAVACLVGVAGVACLLPIRRALAIAPAETIRDG